LDWAAASNESIDYPAQNVAIRFYDYIFGQLHKGRSLAEIPIHLIGHSRGCSLNAKIALNLAVRGVLVDQVTTLDPHPVRPVLGNDLIPVTYINVLFADNYYRTGLTSGESIAGATNANLSEAIRGTSLFCNEHTEVHTYYHGTIALTSTTDGDCAVEDVWYQKSTARNATGYSFSRFVNPRLTRPLSGINESISGAGGMGSRVSVASAQQDWSNAGFDQRSTIPSVVTVGQEVGIPYYFADWSSAQTITFQTDADTNPFNSFRSQIGSTNQNSLPTGSIGTGIFRWTPTTADVGTHYIRIRGGNAKNARFDYYFRPITVQVAPVAAPSIASVSPSALASSISTQLINIYGSNFKAAGDPSASTLIIRDPANIAYVRAPIFLSSSQLQYNITVQSAVGKW